MDSAILSRLRREPGVKICRIASGRGPIIAAFDNHTPRPLWIAKTASNPEHVRRVRHECEALTYLAPWSSELGIPQVLDWKGSCGQAVLIQSGVPGIPSQLALPVDAGDGFLRRHFQDTLAWTRKFQAKVPAPSAITVAELAQQLIEDLERREFGSAASGLIEILRHPGTGGLRSVVPAHGDFYPANVLVVRRDLSVVDWATFGPGFPLQDAFSFLVNSDYYRRGHILQLVENYHHAFFSDSGVNRLVRGEIEAEGYSGDESRYLFYCFLATQICADTAIPRQVWLDILRYVEVAEYPAPCTPLPAPCIGSDPALGPLPPPAAAPGEPKVEHATPESAAPAQVPPQRPEEFRPVRSLLVYATGIVGSKLASLILVPLYTHLLTQAQYGTLELLDVTLQGASKLLWSGLPFAFWYFYANKNTEAERKRVVSTAALGALALGSAAALAGILLAPWISQLLWGSPANATLVRILFAGLACAYPLDLLLAWFRIIDAPVKFVVSGLGRLFLQISGVVLLLVVCGMGLAGILWSSVVAGATLAVVLFVYVLRRNGTAFEPRLFGKMLAYATPSIFVGLCSFLVNFGDRYFLVRSVPLAELAIYSVAYKFGMLITLMSYAFQSYWNAQSFHVAKDQSSGVVFGRALTYLTLALCGATLGITAFVKPVLRLVAPPAYATSAPLVPLICSAYVAFGLSAYFQTLFYVRKRTVSDAIVNGVGALVVVSGYAILIPRYHLWGAAAATLASFGTMLLIGAVWSRRFISVDFEWARLSKVIISAAALAAVYLFLPLRNVAAQVGAGVLALAGYPLLLFAAGFPNEGEKRVVARYLAKTGLFA